MTLGAYWKYSPNLHLGSFLRIPNTIRETVQFQATVASSNISYYEDVALHNPWVIAFGASFNLEHDWVFFFEGDFIGPTQGGFLLSFNTLSSAVNENDLVGKGHNVVFESHIGARKSIYHQKLIAHMGSYFEPSRSQWHSGRLHATSGLSYKFSDWLEIIGGIDVAKNYKQLLFTIR